ncbi:MAG TPA: hypothetical protein VF412_16185 [Bdellovibrio sp.]|uniref:hypothetical protein n=1 Tax=Bdellovibrio sp. TaxID=28201 RepID=UPI002F1FC086
MKCSLLTLLVLLSPIASFAQGKAPETKPLLFPADKNNLQVLPQRFEYSLWDENRLSVGDVLIDSTQVTFSLEPSKTKAGQYSIRFTWPAGLLKEGQLSIKNNSGKAIYSADLEKGTVKYYRGRPMADRENLRSDIASYTVPAVDAQTISTMKLLPFMVFCIYREAEGTRLYLCSKELYLTNQNGQIVVRPRNPATKTAQVEINGTVVGNQGIIYLNDRNEAVNFRAQTKSGSTLEIETRRNDVDFKDAVEDGNNIILTASGAEPVDENAIKRLSPTDWQVVLPKERPIVFLKGDGDIPMRQEFNIKGPLPQEKFRPFTSSKAATKTYASSLSLQVSAPAEGQISADPSDANAHFEQQGSGYRWSLTGIPSGEDRHYLTVQEGANTFYAAYDTNRGSPFDLYLGASYSAPSGLLNADLGGQWWIENFLLMNSSWSHLHWGLGVDHVQHLTDKADFAKVDLTTIELLWRAHAGFNMIDETWGLMLPFQIVKGDSDSTTMFGLGAFWQKQTKKKSWLRFMNWSEVKLHYYLGSSGNFKVKNAYRLEADAYKQFSPKSKWYLRYGLGLSQYKYDPSAAKEDMQLDINAAALWKF